MTPLRQRMLEDMRIRNFARNTQSSYLIQVGAFAKHFGKSPEELGPDEIRAWQIHLLEVKKLTPQSIGIAAAALRFLYKVTLKREWPVEEIPLPKQQVLDYLGRYTHRVAISNNRLLDIDNGKIRFRWKDYRHGSAKGVMTLDAAEFIRRFLLHVVPTGFMRIRHYGFLANCLCEAKLACCRRLLGAPAQASPSLAASAERSSDSGQDYRDHYEKLTGNSLRMCPHCKTGHMVRTDTLPPDVLPRAPPRLESA